MTWSLKNIQELDTLGVSPHLENDVDNSGEAYQLYYTGNGGVTIAAMSTNLKLTQEGQINFIQDLTIVTTTEGIRRAYYIEVDPNSGKHEIFTALISKDGLSLSGVSSTGISHNGDEAWGVPDSVVLPDGRVRIYWVKSDTEATTLANEVILSATSTTTKGTNFLVDSGKRVEGGYVDFEVLKAEDNDWIAIMSSSPVTLPDQSQGIYVGVSNDGLTWEINETNLAPPEKSYLDPTGLLFSNSANKWRLIMSSSLSILGDREYSLVAAELTFTSNSATDSSDIINGTSEANEINALDGADSITGSGGNDVIDGGAGSDTCIYSSKFADYSFTRSTDTLQIADQRTTATNDGTDTLKNIEYIQFSDQTVEESKVDVIKNYSGIFSDYKFYNKGNGSYEIKSNSGTTDDITGLPLLTFTGESTTSSFRDISAIVDIKGTFDQVTGLNTKDAKMFRLYNAAFKRLPDSDGLKYWIGKYTSGENDDRAVASSFLVSAEFKQRYGEDVTNAKYVETLYVNVLGREYDQEGYNYWLGNLNSGLETRYELLLGFAESAENKALFTEMTGFG
ncbi:DUF4214 domain-containing protein [Prochlorococcus sp. MIT 0801]|uniref:DUF4214 domain-containing protein n=1 Tax=Prochlorococcus sp. MIT 0801 TaxID=1501269 RepID=UPI0004F6C44B|nr:DUF4214 domain-containing protein [Prochlorococcus sp. MIT 0801]AIQ96174.1 hypothetical protein EW15_0082 [Prochlorococcus sp. MIT 0801]